MKVLARFLQWSPLPIAQVQKWPGYLVALVNAEHLWQVRLEIFCQVAILSKPFF